MDPNTTSWVVWIPAGVAVVSAIAAIAAAVTSAVITGRAMRRKAIAEFRQAWINDFRSDIADYLGAVRRHQEIYDQGSSQDEKANTARQQQLGQMRAKADPAYYRIRLRINPRTDNPDRERDQAFLEAIDALHRGVLRGTDRDWKRRIDQALAQGQKLLKREWEVTKNG